MTVSRRSFLDSVVVPAVIERAVEALRPADIGVMPLKGALLQRWVYADPAERSVGDVDLLVAPGRYDEAGARLGAAGFERIGTEPGDWQSVWRHPDLPLPVDLHRWLSRSRRHRLTPEALFARGAVDETLFGVPVTRPDPRDLFAHLIAHASSTYRITGRLHRPADLVRTPEALALDPADLAAHLARTGVPRHARLVLPLVTEATGDRFAADVLARLPRDPTGRAVAALARWSVARTGRGSPVRRATGLLLNPTLAEAARAGAEAAGEAVRGWRRPRRAGP